MFNKTQYFDILKNLTILYIEDEKSIKENIKKTLLLFCTKVFDAEDIKSAKNVLMNHHIDLVISDINLPDSTGIELIKEIREKDKTLPIVILSAYTDKHYLLGKRNYKEYKGKMDRVSFEEFFDQKILNKLKNDNLEMNLT